MDYTEICEKELGDTKICENAFEEAYEKTSPSLRCLLKRGIQCCAKIFGKQSDICTKTIKDADLGLEIESMQKPLDWTLFVLDSSSLAPARIAFATLMANLAGVPNRLVVCVTYPSEALLHTLDLCGINDVFVLTKQKLASFAPMLSLFGAGGVVLFGSSIPDALTPYPLLFHEKTKPNLVQLDTTSFDQKCLQTLHGLSPYLPDENKCPKALFAKSPQKAKDFLAKTKFPNPYLIITPGFEGLWIEPNITPQTFLQKTQIFTTGL